MSSSYKSCSFSFSLIFKTELEDAADLVLFLMDHTFLADDHLALNETTFTWPDRIMPIIKMRYIYIYLQPGLANRPFYRYGGHIELIRFKEYYGMPRGMSTFRLYFRALFGTFFLKVFLE